MSFKEELCQDLSVSMLELISQLNIMCHSLDELYAFFYEECHNLLEKYQIDSKEKLSAIFLPEITYQYLNQEDINTLKQEILNGNDKYDALRMIHLFEENELTVTDLKRILNRLELKDEYASSLLKIMTSNKYFCLNVKLDFLTNENIELLGIENIERLCSYASTQDIVLNVLNDNNKKGLLISTIDLLKKNTNNVCAEIEKLCEAINRCYYDKVKDILDHQELLFAIKNGGNWEKDDVYEQQILNCSNLEELRINILKRLFRVDLDEALKIVETYGTDIEKLYNLEKAYRSRVFIEQIINMKSIIKCDNRDELMSIYEDLSILEVISPYEFNNFYEMIIKDSYSKTISDSINKENHEIVNEQEEYVVYDISDDFSRMVTVVDAYGDEKKGSFLNTKWLTPESKVNHARCYSLVGDANFGIYYKGYQENAIMVSIKEFPSSALVAGANKDIGSNSLTNISNFFDQRYMLGTSYFNNTRGRDNYSEFVIENEKDLLNQINSFICIDEVNDATIEAAKEIYNRTGKKINIEVVRPLRIIENHNKTINEKLELFKESKDINLFIEAITIINNDISAFCRGMTPEDVLECEYDQSVSCYCRFAEIFNREDDIHNDKNICAIIDDALQMFKDNPDKATELENKLLEEISKGNLDNSFYWRLNFNNEVKNTIGL